MGTNTQEHLAVGPIALDRSRQAAPQVFERLRDLIVSLELPPGTVLSRQELAERFGLSQTPVRDALIRLGAEGLVDIFPQHATVVSRIDLSAARQSHFLRRAVELEVARTLAEQTDDVLIARLQRHVAVQQALADGDDYTEFVRADHAFHRDLYESASVPDLWEVVRRGSGQVDRLRRLHLPMSGKMQAVVQDHRRIVDAIAQRDPELAQRRVREHLSGTLGKVDEIQQRFPAYVQN